ncbi:MAG: hypothetical protein SFX18_11790 [Pirellulales bacterium]|nr:hypothetical protein [Pirellulales bacterium]
MAMPATGSKLSKAQPHRVSNPPHQVRAGEWSVWTRRVVSVLLVWHLSAQVLATWTGAEPVSTLGRLLSDPFRPYITAASLDQGYRFFAPDPGPSHILRFQVLDKNQQPLPLPEWFATDETRLTGQLPPPGLRVTVFGGRPRLLYHRYFMLTEQVLRLFPQPGLPPATSSAQLQHFRIVMNSFAQELLRQHGGETARLTYLRHHLLQPDVAMQELAANPGGGLELLSHPESYQELWSGQFTKGQTLELPVWPADATPSEPREEEIQPATATRAGEGRGA